MTVISIANSESGSSVRTKLNNTGLRAFDPFFGQNNQLWTRPGLDISGDGTTHFNAWLNQTGDPTQAGLGNCTRGVNPNIPPRASKAGSGYVPNDTITTSGGSILPVNSTTVVSATIVNAGSGATPGSATVDGTTGSTASEALFRLRVTIGAGGTISSIDDIVYGGDYQTNPTLLTAEPVSDSSGSGLTGAVVSVVMGVYDLAADAITVGTPESNPVAQASTSGVGVGAEFTMYFNANAATATDNTGGAPLVVEFDYSGPLNQTFADVTGLLKDAPTTPYTITVGLASAAGDFGAIPIMLHDTTKDVLLMLTWWGIPISTASDMRSNLFLQRFTSSAVGAGEYQSPYANLLFLELQSYFQWFRVTNDGTNIIFYASYENLFYFELYRTTLVDLGMSVDKIGFGATRVGYFREAGHAAVVLWNWVES